MAVVERRFRALFWTLFGIFVLYGTSMTIIGATLPRILADFHWDYVTAGAVIAAGAVAYFLATFGAGYLVHAVGPKATLLLGVVLDLVGLAFFGAGSDPVLNFVLSFLIGLGQGCFEVTINGAVVRLDTRKNGGPLNVVQGAFAIGAIAGPLVLGLLLSQGGAWTLIYRGMAAVFVVLLVGTALVKFVVPAVEPATDAARPARLSAHPAYWLAFVVLFFYVGVEMGVSNWVSEYFKQRFHFDASLGSTLVSLFWVGILIGRFGVPAVSRRARPGRQLLLFTALVTGSVAVLTLLGSASGQAWAPGLAMVAVFGTGLGCSICYPVVITLVGLTFPQAQSQAIGFAATGGGIGVFLFPFLMAAMSQAWGIQWGFAAYATFALAMTVSAVFLVRAARS